MKTKDEIAIKLTYKNRKKVQGILEMFGESINYKEFEKHDVFHYVSDCKIWNAWVLTGKPLIKPNELRTILAKEKLKIGDYVVYKNKYDVKHIFKINSLGDCCLNYDKRHSSEDNEVFDSVGGWEYKCFKRYASKEEIEALEGETKELEAGKWYNFSFDDEPDCIRGIYFIDEIEDYKVWFKYGLDIDIDRWHDSKDWYNKSNIWQEATQQEVEETLIKEAKKRGIISGATVKDEYGNTFKNINGSYVFRNNKLAYGGCIIFEDGKWATVIKEDKFAELKEACKNGAVIQYKNSNTNNKWKDCKVNYPSWYDWNEYRIKPEEKPKVGDVVTDGQLFKKVRESTHISTGWKVVTQQQVIDLLFNDE